jgi:hypothetical protein
VGISVTRSQGHFTEYSGLLQPASGADSERLEAWTDGSLGPERKVAGCAAVTEDATHMARVDSTHELSSTTAELGGALFFFSNNTTL